MSVQPKKNLIKKFLYMAGVASASVCLNAPAFALITSNPSALNLALSEQSSSTDSNVKSIDSLAQSGTQSPSDGGDTTSPGGANRTPADDRSGGGTTPGGGSTMPSSAPSGGGRTMPSSAPSGGGTRPTDPTGGNRQTPSPSNTTPSTERSYSGTMSSPEKGSWACLNNPNPVCRS